MLKYTGKIIYGIEFRYYPANFSPAGFISLMIDMTGKNVRI